MEWITSLDRTLFVAINNGLASPILDEVMPPITDLGLGHVQAVIMVATAAGIGLSKYRKSVGTSNAVDKGIREAKWWLVPGIIALLLCLSVNFWKLIPRERPSWYYLQETVRGRPHTIEVHTVPGVRPIRVRGFPSGHTTSSVALTTTLLLVMRKRRLRFRWQAGVMWTLAGLIGISRIYLADHWPLDVAGGVIWGLLCGSIAFRLTHRSSAPPGPSLPSD